MAFTRSFLTATGLTEEQVKAVMEEHVSVVDALKADRDKFKAEAEKLPGVQKELDDLKGGENWKEKFENEHKSFEDFKAKTAQDAEAAKVRAAYRKLLIEEKIGEKWLDRVMESADFSGMKLDKDGNLAYTDKLKEALDKKWGDVKTTVTERGAKVETPPQTGKASMTKEQILSIKDSSERQKAIAENLNLFGKG
jgi:hypothetical protein